MSSFADHISTQPAIVATGAILHEREDSGKTLDELFSAANVAVGGGQQLQQQSLPPTRQVPMRMRNLPASFFNPGAHSRQSSIDSGTASLNLAGSFHVKQHSSPAAMQPSQTPAIQPHRLGQNSYEPARQYFDPLGPLPAHIERSFTDDGKEYFMDHLNKTTTWEDPRTHNPLNRQLPQILPEGEGIGQLCPQQLVPSMPSKPPTMLPRLMQQLAPNVECLQINSQENINRRQRANQGNAMTYHAPDSAYRCHQRSQSYDALSCEMNDSQTMIPQQPGFANIIPLSSTSCSRGTRESIRPLHTSQPSANCSMVNQHFATMMNASKPVLTAGRGIIPGARAESDVTLTRLEIEQDLEMVQDVLASL